MGMGIKTKNIKILFEFHFIKFIVTFSHTVHKGHYKNFSTLPLHFKPISGSQTSSTKLIYGHSYGHNEIIMFFPLMLTSLAAPKL
jgi:hypothetical protein